MQVIVTLFPRKISRQCFQCSKWTYKKENYAKKPRCSYCDSDKHDANIHSCIREYKNVSKPCPYPSKCIVYNGPYIADFECYLLRTLYSKPKRPVKKFSKLDVTQICE